MRESRSEQDGLNALSAEDTAVLSIGVSTGGEAEIQMLKGLLERTVVATTLDEAGLKLVRKKSEAAGLSDRIELRFEDISSNDLAYADDTFDYIYARLVLHYLTAQQLEVALANIYRILKPAGRVFIVVRSTDSHELNETTIESYDELTHITTYIAPSGRPTKRYFHTIESISQAVEDSGLTIEQIDKFDEDLSPAFNRDNGVWTMNNLIELIVRKP